jgi:hypothetical protein
MYELNAAGQTTNDLLTNLIEALKEAPDSNFQRWLSNQVDLWSMRKLDWKQDGSDLMEEAEIYYKEAMNTHRWGRKTYRPDVQYAFKSTTSDDKWTEVEKEKKQAYIQAKAAYEACMNVSTDDEEGTSNSDNDKDSNKAVSTYSSEDSNIS